MRYEKGTERVKKGTERVKKRGGGEEVEGKVGGRIEFWGRGN